MTEFSPAPPVFPTPADRYDRQNESQFRAMMERTLTEILRRLITVNDSIPASSGGTGLGNFVRPLLSVPFYSSAGEFGIALDLEVGTDTKAVRIQHSKPDGTGNYWPAASSLHVTGTPQVTSSEIVGATSIGITTGVGETVDLVAGDEIQFDAGQSYFVASNVSIGASSSGNVTIEDGLDVALTGGEALTWTNRQTEVISGTGLRTGHVTVQIVGGAVRTYSAGDAVDPIQITLTPLESDGTEGDPVTLQFDDVDNWPWGFSLAQDQATNLYLLRRLIASTGIEFDSSGNVTVVPDDFVTLSTLSPSGTPTAGTGALWGKYS